MTFWICDGFNVAHHRVSIWIEEKMGENNLDRFSVRPRIPNQMKVDRQDRFVYATEAEAAAVVMTRTWVDSHVRNDLSN